MKLNTNLCQRCGLELIQHKFCEPKRSVINLFENNYKNMTLATTNYNKRFSKINRENVSISAKGIQRKLP